MIRIADTAGFALLAGEAGVDPIEERLRRNVRATIEAVFEGELAGFATTGATARRKAVATGAASGTSATETVRLPRARIGDGTGKVPEWRSKALP